MLTLSSSMMSKAQDQEMYSELQWAFQSPDDQFTCDYVVGLFHVAIIMTYKTCFSFRLNELLILWYF